MKDPEILFHHRFPTSTENVQNACHPFSTKSYFGDTQFVMIHNGWLENGYELATEHEALGITYVSRQKDERFNDSEALMYDLALVLTGQKDEVDAEGPVAFVMVERYKGEPIKLHFARNAGKPLNMQLTEAGLSLSSEGPGTPIKPDTLHSFDYVSGEIDQSPFAMSEGAFGRRTYHPRTFRDDIEEAAIVNDPIHYAKAPADDEHYATAGELLATWGNYTDAISQAEGRKRRAEHKLVVLGDEMEEAMDAGTASALLDAQMEQIRIVGHYEQVLDLLKKWLVAGEGLEPARGVGVSSYSH